MTPLEITNTREGLRMDYFEFGKLLGVTELTVIKWEDGQVQPSNRNVALMQQFRIAIERAPEGFIGMLHLAFQHGGPLFALYRILHVSYELPHLVK